MQHNHITYRPILPSDNPFLSKIIKQTFIDFGAEHHEGTVFSDPTTDYLYEYFDIDKALCWVAEESGTILGCGGIYPTEGLPDSYTELVKLYLSAAGRGRGIGKTIFQKCLQSAQEAGYKNIYLESLPEFNKAVSIYEKAGFKHIDHPLGASGHYGCDIWMVKKL